MTNQSLAELYQEVNLLHGQMTNMKYYIETLQKTINEQKERLDHLISFAYAKEEKESDLINRIEYLESLHEQGITLCGEEE